MANESIVDIYEEVRLKMTGLKIKEAKKYFDRNNIPDSLADNTFIIAPVDFGESDFAEATNRLPLFSLKGNFSINVSYKLPANNIIAKMKSLAGVVENIIKAILSLPEGQDQKDNIKFSSAEHTVENGNLVYEIIFGANYRIKNI